MAITIQYNPSLAAGGQLAYEAGRGRFLQDRDRFNYERLLRDQALDLQERQFSEGQRQFDANYGLRQDQLALQSSQFDRSQQMQAELARMQNRRSQDQLALQAYQYDAGLAQRGQLAEAELALQSQREGRLNEWMQLQNEQQQAATKARERAAMRGDLLGIRKEQEQQKYALAMQELDRLEEARADGLPVDQYDQAKEQWLAKYGNHPAIGGVYPSDIPADPRQPEAELERRKQRFVGSGTYTFGDGDSVSLFSEDEFWDYYDMDGDQVVPKEDVDYNRDKTERIKMEYAKRKDEAKRKSDEAAAAKQQEVDQAKKIKEAEEAAIEKYQTRLMEESEKLSEYQAAMSKYEATNKRLPGSNRPKPVLEEFGFLSGATRSLVDSYPPGTYFINNGKLWLITLEYEDVKVEGPDGVVTIRRPKRDKKEIKI